MGKRKISTPAGSVGKKQQKVSLPSSDVHALSISGASSSSRGGIAGAMGTTSRPLKRRSTDEQVERCITTKLQGVPRQSLESRPLPCGRLLRTKLAADIRATRGSGRLGSRYWRGIRAFFGHRPELESIKVDKTQPVSEELILGMQVMSETNTSLRSCERLVAYMETCPGLNPRELVGIMKVCSSPKLTTTQQAHQAVLSTLRCVARAGVMEQSMHILTAARDLIDTAMTCSFNAARKNKVDSDAWVQVSDAKSSTYQTPVAVVSLGRALPMCWLDVVEATKAHVLHACDALRMAIKPFWFRNLFAGVGLDY